MNLKNTILSEIAVKQWTWYGQIQRMEENRLPQILNWIPHGRRNMGRPKTRWKEGIQRAMAEGGLEEGQWIDHQIWRLGIQRWSNS